MSPSERDTRPDVPIEGGRRSGDRRRVRGPGRWVMTGIILALVLGVVVIAGITRTERGRDEVLAFTIATIGGRLNGSLEVDRLDGNLITGARLYDISLNGPDGLPLAVVDSAYIQYRLVSFLGGDMLINRLDVFDANVSLFQMPGDSLWNYEIILDDPTPEPGGEPAATVIERMFVHDTTIEITAPVQGDPRLSPEAQERQVEEALADTVRNVIREVPGGYVQTQRIDVHDAEIVELYIGGEGRGGTYAEIVDGAADVRLWRDPPLQVRGISAQIHLDEGIFAYEAPRLELPNSRAASVGSIDLTGPVPQYDLVIEASQFAIADLEWLYPWLPSDPEFGRGSVRLRVEDREDGLLVLAEDLELTMPDTELTGSFGLIADVRTEGLEFVNVDLEAEPLRIESVEALLPQELPVEGLVIGGATIVGTASRS